MTKTRNIADLLDANGDVVAGALDNVPAVDLTNLSATNLTSGTVPDARFPATLPALNGSALTTLNASNLTSGTLADARFPSTLPAVSGANLTNLPGGGNLLMTDFVSTTTETTTTSQDFENLSGLTFTKTPNSTSSKFILFASVSIKVGDDNGVALRIVRSIGGGSESEIFSDVANTTFYINSSDTSIIMRGKNAINFIDSPNTTSAITYKIQYKGRDPGVILQANNIPSSFLIQEVKV